jgi:succinate dehydrogenase / fumarate reductase flavoprotein subunit
VHGANRLGGNSLLETVVFGVRAGMEALKFSQQNKLHNFSKNSLKNEQNRLTALMERKKGEKAAPIREDMEKTMINSFGIFRNKKLMQQGFNNILELKKRFESVIVDDKGKTYNLDLIRVLELENMLDIAYIVAVGAIPREESRGAHFREDFPEMNNKKFLKHTIVQRDDNGEAQLSYKDVVIEDIEPLSEIKY